jgi:hypothetical protein
LSNVIDHGSRAKPLSGPTTVDHRILGRYYLDQIVDTNGWCDHHQVNSPNVLYAGQGKPKISMHWMSRFFCNAIKDHLDVVPPVFDCCTKLIDKDDEIEARDVYWKVIMEEPNLSEEAQIDLLQYTVELNPYVSEPSVLLSQIHYRREDYYEAAVEVRSALAKSYSLASAWDKRLLFEQWIAFTRVMLIKSKRGELPS